MIVRLCHHPTCCVLSIKRKASRASKWRDGQTHNGTREGAQRVRQVVHLECCRADILVAGKTHIKKKQGASNSRWVHRIIAFFYNMRCGQSPHSHLGMEITFSLLKDPHMFHVWPCLRYHACRYKITYQQSLFCCIFCRLNIHRELLARRLISCL